MTIDPTDTPIDDSQMFAPVPSWERGKKRRSFGRRAAEPRSFAPVAAADPILDAPMTETKVDRLGDADPASNTFAAPPVYAARARAKSSSAPVAITAGLILIGGIAAAGWYYTQPHGQTGVAELTPGGTTTTTTDSTTASTGATPAAPPSQVAQNAPPPAAVRTTTTTTRASHNAPPVRTHATRAASDTAADASTRAPAQAAPAPMPLPTPGVAPPAAAAPAAPLVLNIPPAAEQATPQPVTPQVAPQTTAPPPIQVPQA